MEIYTKVEARRDYTLHPNGLAKFKLTLQNDTDRNHAQHVFPPSGLPAGYSYVVKWVSEWEVEVGAELTDPTTAAKATESSKAEQSLESLSDADLMTKCAENNIKYNAKKFDRFQAIVQLKEKTANPRKELAGVGA